MKQVIGLRETLEDSDDEDVPHESTPAPEHLTLDLTSSSGTILFDHGSISIDTNVLQPPTEQMRNTLLRLYRYRVDSIFKVVHWPTVIITIEKSYTDAPNVSQSPAMQALEFAIYFMALCSVTDDESETMLLGRRGPLLQQYRLATEILLSRANLFGYPVLTVLQAFVIYVVSRLLMWQIHVSSSSMASTKTTRKLCQN